MTAYTEPSDRELVTQDRPSEPSPSHAASWRTVVALILAIPIVVSTIAAMFVSLAVDPGPHDVPLGLVAPAPAASAIETALADRAGEDAFAVEQFADPAAARRAIESRDIVGAIAVGPQGVTVLTAEAGSPALAGIVAGVGTGIATAQSLPVTTESVVAPPATDVRGTGFAAGLLPLLIAGIALGAASAIALAGRVWMQATVVLIGPLIAGLGFAAVWSWLGVIDGRVLPVALALALMIGAISWFTAGAGALLGAPGVGIAAILMMLISNPLSGLASSPYLLPAPWGALGQWLPTGAGGTLTRSVAYFPDAAIAGPLWVLLGWLGIGAILLAVSDLRLRRA
ncbi:ABC transporter permease [Gordonia rubripertincta]|uniref:ABC transporter permease n=2 Tax=Gordonia rubripertincta TaxID=36822 RepID=A0AAW6R7C2_GORRU|nr:hypothetical protein [Gordonia rubripertincta]MDG6782227.1 ABC transporter permease [Gordonia rubripertincta]NKY65035.1 ABC transporter permease [Gordonia rubripertincta]GAB84787.1 hypothetical protein GORBP_046_00180 [Gordonia rubripertincta NBRC 101908]